MCERRLQTAISSSNIFCGGGVPGTGGRRLFLVLIVARILSKVRSGRREMKINSGYLPFLQKRVGFAVEDGPRTHPAP